MIPIDEQPYPLPDGWQWVTLDSIAECLDNLRSPVNAAERAKRPGKIPYYGATGQVGWIDDFLTDEQLVLLGEDGAPFLDMFKDKAYIIEGKAWINNHAHILRSRFGSVGNKFLCYYLNAFDFSNHVNGTTRLKLTQSKMKKIPFPLTPLNEQQRIVSLLDELFSKLDEAKALAQAIVDGSELRRAAILHKAFTGELTKLWREEHGITLDSWQRRTVASVCKGLIYGTSKKSKSSGKMIVLRMGNLQNGEIDWNDLAYSDDERDIKKYLLSTGDVLFNRTNSAELVGKTSIYRGEYPAIYAGYLIKLDYDRDILNGEYLNYVLNSPNAKEYCNHVKTDGVNQSNINARKIGAYVIPLPPLNEQKEIVRLLDDLLGREQRTKELALKTVERVELVKKSILVRAFRGELGTNKNLREI